MICLFATQLFFLPEIQDTNLFDTSDIRQINYAVAESCGKIRVAKVLWIPNGQCRPTVRSIRAGSPFWFWAVRWLSGGLHSKTDNATQATRTGQALLFSGTYTTIDLRVLPPSRRPARSVTTLTSFVRRVVSGWFFFFFADQSWRYR